MTANYKQYNEEKKKFFEKHENSFRCETNLLDTSSMEECSEYYKNYIFADGAMWNEVMSLTYEVVGVRVLRTEFSNTDIEGSKYYDVKF